VYGFARLQASELLKNRQKEDIHGADRDHRPIVSLMNIVNLIPPQSCEVAILMKIVLRTQTRIGNEM
jgi:hypothetical protein